MTEKLEQVPETYDEMFRDGGFAGIFDLPYKSSPYLPMFKEVLGELKRNGAKSVMEVGCGTGAFAHLLLDTTNMAYRGFDFSGVAVDRAKKRFGKPDLFFQGDARDAGCYDGDFDAIVCTEVLEHVVEDLDVVSIWPADRLLVCSVPNFDAATHERFFRTEDEVTSRYGQVMDIDRVTRVKKPVLNEVTFRNYLQALRWKRNKPKEIMEILGFGDFDAVGGWFIFSGKRR